MPQHIRKLVLKHKDESLEQFETRVNEELEKLKNYSEDEASVELITDSQYLAILIFYKKGNSIKKKIGF